MVVEEMLAVAQGLVQADLGLFPEADGGENETPPAQPRPLMGLPREPAGPEQLPWSNLV